MRRTDETKTRMRKDYIAFWNSLFHELLEWNSEDVDHWASGLSYLMDDPNSIFYHEAPIYYAAPQLVPADLMKALTRMH